MDDVRESRTGRKGLLPLKILNTLLLVSEETCMKRKTLTSTIKIENHTLKVLRTVRINGISVNALMQGEATRKKPGDLCFKPFLSSH